MPLTCIIWLLQVTRSGNLRSLRQSVLSLEKLPGDAKALTFHQFGTPLLLLMDKTLEIVQMCQAIPETLPSLGPASGIVNTPQTWLDLDNYKACGDLQLDTDKKDPSGRGSPVQAMLIDGGLRYVVCHSALVEERYSRERPIGYGHGP